MGFYETTAKDLNKSQKLQMQQMGFEENTSRPFAAIADEPISLDPPAARGLARFRSAPVSFLESLLQEEEPSPEPDPEPVNQCLHNSINGSVPATDPLNYGSFNARIRPFQDPPRLFHADAGVGNAASLLRHTSLPPELISQVIPATVNGISANYGSYAAMEILGNKRARNMGVSESSFQSKLDQRIRIPELVGSDAEMEKLLEESAPFGVRAKRGCATHPRSIAERVRRTRISDRIRKLQELVPNMDKQTNTADMLDEAVEYVKLLKKQIQELAEHQRNCKCRSKN
eukprot:TRINITY_DN2783_c0_g1_i1.p1 TRINITY_DN2783_c0_g1~~TRINITY_DN2783_c0_g1_i1.p1  ORF type:complete len:287 (+),score=36.29 TRINITY_DN2783_c0_g1_i1:328-1188(+)